MNRELDPALHRIDRLRICTALQTAGATEGGVVDWEMKMSVLRELTGLSEDVLTEELRMLASDKYVDHHREFGTTRDRDTVWVCLTRAGVAAFDDHVAALRAIAEPAGGDRGAA